MSRATISTGNFTLDAKVRKIGDEPSQPTGLSAQKQHCHIAILSDFSGRDQRGLNDVGTIKNRKIREIDRDNFDEVFESLDVQCVLPLANEPMCFKELDDMHPDFIYEQVPVFNRFKQLKRKLKSKATFAEAAAQIQAWSAHASHKTKLSPTAKEPSSTANALSNTRAAFSSGSMLDDILAGSTDISGQSSGEFDLQALVKDIVGPYVTDKPDPQQKELMANVDDATSGLMRKIMHHRQFQQLESAWRSLYLLVKRLETDAQLKIFIIDISAQEIIDDANQAESFEQSGVYKLLHDSRATIGGKAFSLVTVDTIFGENTQGLSALSQLGETVAAMKASLISGGSEQLAGCENLGLTPDKDDWDFSINSKLSEQWQQLRITPQAKHIALVAPRYLTRMPYGKKTSPIDSFAYEELPQEGKHPYYLWSCGAWLVSLLIAKNYTISGELNIQQVQELEKLPLHVFEDEDGSCVTPCAEIHMYDAAASALREAGLMTVRSILNKDSVIVPELASISSL